jgi:hypothetical protein
MIPSSEDTLGKLVDLQPLLRHLGVLQEVERHPHEMALDLVQLRTDILGRNELVEDMPGLDPLGREEVVVFVEGFDCDLLTR